MPGSVGCQQRRILLRPSEFDFSQLVKWADFMTNTVVARPPQDAPVTNIFIATETSAPPDSGNPSILLKILSVERESEPAGKSASQCVDSIYRHLLENLPAAAYTCDADGLITYFNKRAVELWGRVPKLNEMEDRFCGSFRLFAPDGLLIRHARCWMAKTLHEKSEYYGHEIIIERPDGSRRFALAHATPVFNEAGQFTGAMNVLVDITERKRLETQLQESQKMEAVGRLTGGVAHDFNNMLMAICGQSSLLQEMPTSSDAIRAAAKEIDEAAYRAADLGRQLLASMLKE